MAIRSTGSNQSTGVNTSNPHFSEGFIERLPPEATRLLLENPALARELLAANGLFGVINGNWELSSEEDRGDAASILDELARIDLEARSFQERMASGEIHLSAPIGASDITLYGFNIPLSSRPPTPAEVGLMMAKEGDAWVARANKLFAMLERLGASNPGSETIENAKRSGQLTKERIQRTADLWQPFLEERLEALRVERLSQTTDPSSFGSLVTETTTLSDGTREFVPTGDSLLLNLTGGDDTLGGKVEDGHHFLNINEEGWIRIPANVTRVVINGRAGDDRFLFLDDAWALETLVSGGPGDDTLSRNRFTNTTLRDDAVLSLLERRYLPPS